MSQIVPITPYNASTTSQNTTRLPAAVGQALSQGQTVSVQVAQILSSTSASLNSALGQFTVTIADTTTLTQGSTWLLQKGQSPQSFVLKQTQQTIGQGQLQTAEQSTPLRTTPQSVRINTALNTSQNTAPTQTSQTTTSQRTPAQTLASYIQAHRQDAAVKQNSLSGVFSLLPGLAKKSLAAQGTTSQNKTINSLTQQILGLRVSETVSADSLKTAFQNTGLFRQNGSIQNPQGLQLSQHTNQIPGQETPALNAQGIKADTLKGLLTQLNTLAFQLTKSQDLKTQQAPQAKTSPPPSPEGPLEAQKAQSPAQSLSGNEVLTKLVEQTGEALARLKLLQLSSLPVNEQEVMRGDVSRTQINIELPIALNQDETAIMAARITREEDAKKSNSETSAYKWSIDLAIDTDETGAIDANISLKQTTTRIVIWSAKPQFTDLLKQNAETLKSNLAEAGLDIENLRILNGQRQDFSKYVKPQEGTYWDKSL